MTLFRLLRNALPQGRTLPVEAWRRRHAALLVLLCAHTVALPAFAALRDSDARHILVAGLPLALLAAAALASRRRQRLSAALVSVGLVTSSAVLVYIWGGTIEGHFHFFVIIVLLALYEDWLPFLLAAAYVVVHHGLTGALDPHSVYNHHAAVAHPWRWALIHGIFVTCAGVGAVVTWCLNENVRAQANDTNRRARESEEQFRSAFENAPIGMLLTAIDCENAGRLIRVNSAMCELIGYSAEELVGRHLLDITHADDIASSTTLFARLRAGTARGLQAEQRYLCADGETVCCLTTISLVRDASGAPLHAIAQVVDISEQKRTHAELAHQALHDPLTNLPNRRKLMADLDASLASATAEEPVTFVLFDLDGFKAFNDTFGHAAGDELLAELARRLEAAVEGRGTCYRMGGDEFCAVARVGLDQHAAFVVDTAAALSQQGNGFTITSSHGSVVLPTEAAQAVEVLRRADQRMYAHKGTRRVTPVRDAGDAPGPLADAA